MAYRPALKARGLHTGDPTRNRPRAAPTSLTVGSFLFLGLLLLYVAIGRGQYVAYDANSMVAVGKGLVDHLTLRTTGEFNDYLHLSTPWSPYGIGVSLLVVPVYALSKIVGHPELLISMINPVVTAATAVVIWRIGLQLGWPSRRAVIAAASYGCLTAALQSTTELFSEPSVALCSALLVLGILRWRHATRLNPLLIGLAAGLAIQFRTDSILTVWIGALALPLFVPRHILTERCNVIMLLAPLGLSAVFLGWYNYVRFHSLFVSSYNGGSFTTPIATGLRGLLVSPGKSLFLYSPIALLGVAGLGWLVARRRPVGVMFTLLVVTRILFFAKWTSWEGGVCWGPRFLLPITFILVLAAFALLDISTDGSPMRVAIPRILAVLAVASLPVMYLSIRLPYEQWFSVMTTPSARAALVRDGGPPATTTKGVVEVHALDFSVRSSPLYGDVVLLQHHDALMSPELWRMHDGVSGGVLLGLGSLALLVGIIDADETSGESSKQRFR